MHLSCRLYGLTKADYLATTSVDFTDLLRLAGRGETLLAALAIRSATEDLAGDDFLATDFLDTGFLTVVFLEGVALALTAVFMTRFFTDVFVEVAFRVRCERTNAHSSEVMFSGLFP